MSGHDGRVERAVVYDPELGLMACRLPDGTVVLLDWADLLAADDPGRDNAPPPQPGDRDGGAN